MFLVIVTWQRVIEQVDFEVEIAQVEEELPPLEEMEELPSEAPVKEATPGEIVDIKVEAPPLPTVEEAVPATDYSSMLPEIPKPFMKDTVALIKSPMSMKTISGSGRSHGGRLSALRRYGGTGAGEKAVIRALRYLKSLQLPNGSWKQKGEGNATAFALLAFLAHGEGMDSPEFGLTVRKALEYVRKHRTSNMATYALTEAAGIIRTPILTEEATAAVSKMCQRQKRKIKANAGGVIPRYCGVMALVSAKLAGLRVPELEETQRRFTEGYLTMRDGKASDWKKITGQGVWHFMVASVCLQYLGRGEDPNSKAMLKYLDSIWRPATLGKSEIACCPVRSNLFATTMFFNDGGHVWKKWNDGMIAAYVKTQIVEGDMGYWRCQDKHIGAQPFWPTCYIALQLMTYYRYLPTNSESARKQWTKPRKEVDFMQGMVIEVDI